MSAWAPPAPDGDLAYPFRNRRQHQYRSDSGTDRRRKRVPAEWTIRNNAATGRLTYRNDTAGLTTPFKICNPDAVENLLRVGIDRQ